MAKSENSKNHHHGNLKKALVESGQALLAEGGLAALSLRKCAARAGVSHAAPAHHFKGLKGLVTAIITEGFKTFTQTMIEHRDAATDNPRARLIAIGEGYLAFARAHEAVSTLMFMLDEVYTDDPEYQLAAGASYQVLAEGCAPFKSGTVGAAGVETLVWSLVQGYASLARTGQVDPAATPFATIFPMLDLKES